MKWAIYDKTGSRVKCYVNKLEYNGEFMGASNVTCTVKSDHPIHLEIGDYLDYRGERYTINYDPSVIKRARANTAGDAFTYDGIVFNSYTDELVRCSFLDYVPEDNYLHFTSLPTFSFYAATVKELADRIQANLDRIYKGEEKWTVNVHKDFEGERNQNVSVNNLKVWDALALVNTQFKANFIIRGRTITIGTTGVPASKIFQYGKGNGLKQIERTAEPDQSVITRLRVYGSSKNMPARYYNKIGRNYFVSDVKDKHTSEERNVIGLHVHIGTEFKKGIFTHLVRHETEATEFYDYKVEVKIGELLIDAHLECFTNKNLPSYLFSNPSICADAEKLKAAIRYIQTSKPDKLYITKGVNLDMAPEGNMDKPKYMADNMAVNYLMLPGFPENTLDPCIESKNIDIIGVREDTVIFDGSEEGKEEIHPSIEGMTADELKKAGVAVDFDTGDNGMLDEVADAEQTTENGLMADFSDGKKVPNFTITLKDIGFDINDHLSTDDATISMKDGMCGGREFTIEKCERKGNKWVLTCKRTEDSSLGLYFPYKDYNIKKGDKYVLLGLEMPDVYVKAASQRLLEAGKKYLSENDYVRYSYVPQIDDLEMARQHDNHKQNQEVSLHDSLKEGDLILFEDADLGISGNVILDNLTIVEGDSLIPHYEVSLRNEKTVGTLDKIQNQIDSILSGNGKGGGLNTEQVTNIVKALGAKNYLSKVKSDSTAYLLKLLGGAEFGEFAEPLATRTGAAIDAEGNGMFTTLSAKQMRILTLIINKLTALAGDFVMTESGEIEHAQLIGENTYRLAMVRKHDNDITDLEVDDVLRASLEDMTVNNKTYMGWYRVLSKNAQDNTLTVAMYAPAECEGNVNYPPVENMIVHRWGNATNKERQRCWYISSPEGRIVYLTGVYKPKLETSNYASFYGLPVMLDFLKDKGINPDEPYLWVRGLIAQDIIRVDYQGNVEADIVDRGLYDPAVAKGPDPYLCRAKRSTNGRFETHDVWANSCRYRCLKTGTHEVPKWNAVDWVQISGDTNLYIRLEKPNGDAFVEVIDCPIVVHIFRGVEEITNDISDEDIAWSRDTGDPAADLAWPSQHLGEKKRIRLRDVDCPKEVNRFTVTAFVRDGEEVHVVKAIETIDN